jgi:hypothetical protein
MLRIWGWRIPLLLLGWYFMMSYPLDGSWLALVLAMAVGTSGAVLIGALCYGAGRDASKTAPPPGREEGGRPA